MSLACCYTTENMPFCENRRHGASPLCQKHLTRVIEYAILDGDMPEDCLMEVIRWTDNFIALQRIARERRIDEHIADYHRKAQEEKRRKRIFDCVVYYVRLTGGRIKIGWTSDLPERMKTFRARPEDVLAVEPGDHITETQRHRQFAHLRLGRTEEFREAPDLMAHIESLRTEAA